MPAISNVSSKEKTGLTIAILILGIAFIDRLIINPISGKYAQLNHELKMSEMQLCRDISNINQREAIASDFQKYKQYVQVSGSKEEVTTAVLKEIEEIARRSGITLIDIKPQDMKHEDIYNDYTVEVEAEGTMDSVASFLYNLNSSKQLLRARKFHLTVKDKETSTLRASVLINKIVIP